MKAMKPKPPLGSGQRFAALKAELASRPGVTNPGALAAAIGRKKFSKNRFQAMSAKGRKRHRKVMSALKGG